MNSSLLAPRFARNLCCSRRSAALSQEELAVLAELHRTYVSRLERAGSLPRFDTILKIAAGVEASPCVLLEGLRWRPGHYVEGGFYVEYDTMRRGGSRRDSAEEILAPF